MQLFGKASSSQGFLCSLFPYTRKQKCFVKNLLALAHVLKQFVDLSHQLTGIHEFMFPVVEMVEYIIKIIFFVILGDLLHGRQPFGRRLHTGVSSNWGARVGGGILKIGAGCPGRHPLRVAHGLGRQRRLPALQGVVPVRIAALGVGVQGSGQEALEHAAHLREQGGRAGIRSVLVVWGVLAKSGKALLLLPRIHRLGVILKARVQTLLLRLGWEFLPGNEHVTPVIGGWRRQRRHPALVGVSEDPALLCAEPHRCARGEWGIRHYT